MILFIVDLIYYKFHRTSLRRRGSYIDSPKRIGNKKSTINPKNNNSKCLTVALNHKQIKNYLERISKIKAFIDQLS